MRNSKIIAVTLAFGLMVTFAPAAFAQQATSTDDGAVAESLAEQIAALLEQVQALKSQLAELERQQGEVRQEIAEATRIARNLSRGATGEDVEELQELLASDPEIYPEGLVTGFYGPLTEQAVERLQGRFGISQVGRVGPITRRTVNQLLGNLNQGRGSLNRGPGNIFDRIGFEDADRDGRDDDGDAEVEEVDTSEFPPGTTGVLMCHTSSGFSGSERTIAVGGPAVQAHLAHGDTLGACKDEDTDDDHADDEDEASDEDDSDEEDTDEDEDEDDQDDKNQDNDQDEDDEDADETAPAISDLEVPSSDISSSSAVVRWDTDELADSDVFVSTSTPIDRDATSTISASDGLFVESHEVEIEGLSASTTYFAIVQSEDEAGNAATSSEVEFTTLGE